MPYCIFILIYYLLLITYYLWLWGCGFSSYELSSVTQLLSDQIIKQKHKFLHMPYKPKSILFFLFITAILTHLRVRLPTHKATRISLIFKSCTCTCCDYGYQKMSTQSLDYETINSDNKNG